MAQRNYFTLDDENIFTLDDPKDSKEHKNDHIDSKDSKESKNEPKKPASKPVVEEKKHHINHITVTGTTTTDSAPRKTEAADIDRLENYLEVEDYEGLENYLLASRDGFALLAYSSSAVWSKLITIVNNFQEKINQSNGYTCHGHDVAVRIEKYILDPLMSEIQDQFNKDEVKDTLNEIFNKSYRTNQLSLLMNLSLGRRLASQLQEYINKESSKIDCFLEMTLGKLKSDPKAQMLIITKNDFEYLDKIHEALYQQIDKNKIYQKYCLILDEIIVVMKKMHQTNEVVFAASKMMSEEDQLQAAIKESMQSISGTPAVKTPVSAKPAQESKSEHVPSKSSVVVEDDEDALLAQAIALSLTGR